MTETQTTTQITHGRKDSKMRARDVSLRQSGIFVVSLPIENIVLDIITEKYLRLSNQSLEKLYSSKGGVIDLNRNISQKIRRIISISKMPALPSKATIPACYLGSFGTHKSIALRTYTEILYIRHLLSQKGLSSSIFYSAFPPQMRKETEAGVVIRSFTLAYRLASEKTNDCLPRALALWRILRSHNIEATFSIGVKAGGFSAHAWVEYQNWVVSDNAVDVAPFTTIARF